MQVQSLIALKVPNGLTSSLHLKVFVMQLHYLTFKSYYSNITETLMKYSRNPKHILNQQQTRSKLQLEKVKKMLKQQVANKSHYLKKSYCANKKRRKSANVKKNSQLNNKERRKRGSARKLLKPWEMVLIKTSNKKKSRMSLSLKNLLVKRRNNITSLLKT